MKKNGVKIVAAAVACLLCAMPSVLSVSAEDSPDIIFDEEIPVQTAAASNEFIPDGVNLDGDETDVHSVAVATVPLPDGENFDGDEAEGDAAVTTTKATSEPPDIIVEDAFSDDFAEDDAVLFMANGAEVDDNIESSADSDDVIESSAESDDIIENDAEEETEKSQSKKGFIVLGVVGAVLLAGIIFIAVRFSHKK